MEYGIRGASVEWVASYQSDRTISVHVGKSSSAAVPVLQGSVLGPILFTAYIAPIGRLTEQHGTHYRKYADDTQLYTSLTVPAGSSLDHFPRCTSELQHWYWANGQLLNPTKSEMTFFGTKQRLQWLTLPANVTVAGSSVTVNGVLKILVVTLDSTLTFDDGPCYVVRSCNYYLLDLRHLRPCLSLDVAKTMPASIVGSRL